MEDRDREDRQVQRDREEQMGDMEEDRGRWRTIKGGM